MSYDDNQTLIPPSFVALFVPPGAVRPNASRDAIAARYELCEDMAQMLTEPARTTLWELGVTEHDVLERMARGLCVEGSVVDAGEAGWVTRRLAELLDWPQPEGAAAAPERGGPGRR